MAQAVSPHSAQFIAEFKLCVVARSLAIADSSR
jgi:hypothetical protein